MIDRDSIPLEASLATPAPAATAAATPAAAMPKSLSRGKMILGMGAAAGAASLFSASKASAAGTALVTSPSTSAVNTIQPTGSAAANVVPLTLRAVNNQRVPLTQWLDKNNNMLAEVQGNGNLRTRYGLDILGTTTNNVSTAQPLVVFWNNADNTGDKKQWSLGLDTSDNPPNKDFFIGRVNQDNSGVADIVFFREIEPNRVGIGLNFVPPADASVSISGFDGTNMPGVLVRVGVNQTGDAISVINSAGTKVAAIGPDGSATFPSISTASLTNTGSGPLAINGVRITSPDPEHPNALFLNPKQSNVGVDFQLRAVESSFYGSFFFQVANYDASRTYLNIRQDSGYVGIGNIQDMLAPLDIDGSSIRIRQPFTPASPNAGGYQGQISWDTGNLYVCVAPSTWMRAPLATW